MVSPKNKQDLPSPVRRFIIIFSLIFLITFGAIGLLPNTSLSRNSQVVALFATITAVEIVALSLLIRRLHKNGKSLALFGFGKKASTRAIAIGVVIATVYIFSAYSSSYLDIKGHFTEINSFKVLGASVAILAAFVEEIIFRGYLMTSLQSRGFSVGRQVLISSTVFGLAHAGIFSVWGAFYTIGLGLALSLLYVKSGRSLTPVIVCHALINLFLEPWLILSFLR